MNFNELKDALYHIRVNYLWSYDTAKCKIQLSFRGDGDAIIDVWDEKDKWVGHFLLSRLTEELALLQAGNLDLCDLDANEVEEED
jgi:hypothetical protein